MKKTYIWAIGLVLLGFILAGVFLTMAPDQVPVHYNIHGETDRWGSKYEFLLMPVTNLLFAALMVWIARREGKKGRDMNERIVGILNIVVLVQFNVMWAVFMWKAAGYENSARLDALTSKLILMLLAASLVLMGNIMPKVQRNSAFGLRTKWSMANDHCWQQSQRIGGFIMVAAGIVGTILTALLPVTWGGVVLVALLIAAAAGSTWASYRIYLRSQIQ